MVSNSITEDNAKTQVSYLTILAFDNHGNTLLSTLSITRVDGTSGTSGQVVVDLVISVECVPLVPRRKHGSRDYET